MSRPQGHSSDDLVRSLLERGCAALSLPLDSDTIDNLLRYYRELLRWSSKMNLIGKGRDPEQIIENHFLDSLTLVPLLQRENTSLLDVGSGAGFPGLACRIALPDLQLELVEPRQKRVSFLRHVSRSLHLDGVRIHCARIEELGPDTLSCTHITGRAVADLVDFLAMVHHLADHSRIICMKGPKWSEELQRAEPSLPNLDLRLDQVIEMRLPFSGATRALLIFCR